MDNVICYSHGSLSSHIIKNPDTREEVRNTTKNQKKGMKQSKCIGDLISGVSTQKFFKKKCDEYFEKKYVGKSGKNG